MTRSTRRVLILACSRRKRTGQALMPAVKRYDGPLFRVLRKFLREHPTGAESVDVYILSGKFGLVSASHHVPQYDVRLTCQRADKLQPQVLAQFERIVSGDYSYRDVLICAGKAYRRALDGHERLVGSSTTVTVSRGPIGSQQRDLYRWLRRSQRLISSPEAKGTTRIRGVEVQLSPEQVLRIAEQALADGRGSPDRYYSWYVQVAAERVSTKWLVSQITGLPVQSFVTAEACRVLRQLGIEVVPA